MNSKKVMIGILLVSIILFTFFGRTTLAKYLSSNSKSASMQVARWNITNSFLVNGNAVTTTPINLATTYDAKTLTSGKIAPGTSGTFGITINGTGTETGIDYKITFTNISDLVIENLTYTYKNKIYHNLASLQNELKGTIAANAQTKTVTFEIGWSWPYETLDSNKSSKAGDAKDLEVGESASTLSFDVNIICTQVSPKQST